MNTKGAIEVMKNKCDNVMEGEDPKGEYTYSITITKKKGE